MTTKKAVFLDRDHTLIEDPGYISDPTLVKLLPGVGPAVKSLSQAGFKVIIVTNQSGIARGLLTEETLLKIHSEVRRQLAGSGAHLDAIYFCPFHPEGNVEGYAIDSELRKPRPGMLLKAAKDHNLDLSASWMVGDSPRDVEAGQRAGCRTIRLRVQAMQVQGDGQDEDAQADFTVRNLVEAAKIILREPDVPPHRPVSMDFPHPAQPEELMTDRDILLEILHSVRQVTDALKKK